MRLALLDRLLAERAAGRSAALVTRLDDGRQALVLEAGLEGDLPLDEATFEAARRAAATDRSALIETSTGEVFVEAWAPPARLVVVGAVHIAQALAPMAALAGFAVTVIDPRAAFATPERFPGIEVVVDWPDEAMARIRPDARTAVVTLTHDPKVDDPALEAALRSPAFYVGALGSKRTHAARRDRLEAAGFDTAAIGRVHGPVGLAIGALTPAEIAISILGQITAIRRGAA